MTRPAAPVAGSGVTAGSVSAGAVVSVTATENVPVPVAPTLSVTVQVTGVVPTPNVEPEAGEQIALTTPSSMSFPVCGNVITRPAWRLASSEMFGGGV